MTDTGLLALAHCSAKLLGAMREWQPRKAKE